MNEAEEATERPPAAAERKAEECQEVGDEELLDVTPLTKVVEGGAETSAGKPGLAVATFHILNGITTLSGTSSEAAAVCFSNSYADGRADSSSDISAEWCDQPSMKEAQAELLTTNRRAMDEAVERSAVVEENTGNPTERNEGFDWSKKRCQAILRFIQENSSDYDDEVVEQLRGAVISNFMSHSALQPT